MLSGDGSADVSPAGASCVVDVDGVTVLVVVVRGGTVVELVVELVVSMGAVVVVELVVELVVVVSGSVVDVVAGTGGKAICSVTVVVVVVV